MSGEIELVKQMFDDLVKSRFIEMFGNILTNSRRLNQTPINQQCIMKAGKAINSKDLFDSPADQLFPCYGGNGIRGYIGRYSHEGIYPIVGRQGALCGNVNLATGRFYATEHAVVVTPTRPMNPIWLYYVLKELKLERFATASAQPGLSVGKIEKIPMPDVTITLQNEFASFVEQVDKSKIIFEREVARYEELVKSRFIELNKRADGIRQLGQFIQIYVAKRACDETYPVLSITKEHGIVLQEDKFKKRIASADTSDYKIVPRGILVQGIHIDERNFGIQNLVDEGIVSPAYKLWKVNCTVGNPEYIAYAMRSEEFARYVQSKFRGSIRRRENVTTQDILEAPLHIPSLEIQNEFVSFLKQVDKSKSDLINTTTRLLSMKQ